MYVYILVFLSVFDIKRKLNITFNENYNIRKYYLKCLITKITLVIIVVVIVVILLIITFIIIIIIIIIITIIIK